MKLTKAQVKEYYLKERIELYFATEAQIYDLCDVLGTDQPLMHWHMCREEMDCMLADALAEFG